MANRMIIMIAMLALWLSAIAQDGMNISPFFAETYSQHPYVSTVTISGDKLKKSDLSLYRSVTVTDSNEAAKLANAVWTDGLQARQKEIAFVNGKLNFGFYTLKSNGKTNRYMLFLNNFNNGGDKALIIYMEGRASTSQINEMLAKFKK